MLAGLPSSVVSVCVGALASAVGGWNVLTQTRQLPWLWLTVVGSESVYCDIAGGWNMYTCMPLCRCCAKERGVSGLFAGTRVVWPGCARQGRCGASGGWKRRFRECGGGCLRPTVPVALSGTCSLHLDICCGLALGCRAVGGELVYLSSARFESVVLGLGFTPRSPVLLTLVLLTPLGQLSSSTLPNGFSGRQTWRLLPQCMLQLRSFLQGLFSWFSGLVHLHFALCDRFLCCAPGCQSAVWQNGHVHPACSVMH